MSDTVEQKVIQIIAEQAVMEPAKVDLTSTLEDLGIDSLGVVETIFSIEETFDISVPFNANDPDSSPFDISDVGSIVDAVKELVTAKAG
ncbi:MAG: acyl carrier protein [Pseudomonadota bacterium]